jgi:O-antigen/teichoic acid export membrane protein
MIFSIKGLVGRASAWLFNEPAMEQVLKRAAAFVALKFAGLAFGLATAAILGRLLRPEQYGLYLFALSTITLLALPVQVGLPQLLVREIAKNQLAEKWGLIRGIVRLCLIKCDPKM